MARGSSGLERGRSDPVKKNPDAASLQLPLRTPKIIPSNLLVQFQLGTTRKPTRYYAIDHDLMFLILFSDDFSWGDFRDFEVNPLMLCQTFCKGKTRLVSVSVGR